MKTRELNRLYFDIETVASADAVEWLPEPRVDSRIKDPVKVAAAIEEKRVEALDRAPLDPDLATVRAISSRITTGGPTLVCVVPGPGTPKVKATKKVDKYEATAKSVLSAAADIIGLPKFDSVFKGGVTLKYLSEADALRSFWGQLIMCSGNNVGFNQTQFDLPFLMRRSMAQAISPGITPALSKYRAEPSTDLFGLMFNWAWGETKKLKWLATRYGLDPLVNPDKFSGGAVADMDDAELVAYALSDLHITVNLYRRMNGIYFSHTEVGY